MSKSSVPVVQPPPQDWEQTLEQTEQQVIDGKIDTIDTEARYLGMLAFLFLSSVLLYRPSCFESMAARAKRSCKESERLTFLSLYRLPRSTSTRLDCLNSLSRLLFRCRRILPTGHQPKVRHRSIRNLVVIRWRRCSVRRVQSEIEGSNVLPGIVGSGCRTDDGKEGNLPSYCI